MKRTSFVSALLVICFTLLQAVVPPGMMPVRGANGVEIVICTGDGLQTLVLDETGRPVPPEDRDAGPGFCAFAPVLAKLPPALVPDPVAVPRLEQRDPLISVMEAPVPMRRSASRGARAPPVAI